MIIAETLLALTYVTYRIQRARRIKYFKETAKEMALDPKYQIPIAIGMARLSLIDKKQPKETWLEKFQNVAKKGYKIMADNDLMKSGKYFDVNAKDLLITVYNDPREKMAFSNAVRYALKEAVV